MTQANQSGIKVGIVGACARGASFKLGCDAVGLDITAACDINADGLDAAAARLGAREQYTDYETMLAKAGLDAVIIGTPMPLHVPQAIAALQRGIHVLCEVPAGVSLDECRALVKAASDSTAVYMMAENYAYTKLSVLVRELVRQGEFGTTYYAEGEYLHELKELNEITKWRRTWQTGIAGVTYCTHSLGPVLQWMPGDRVTKVCCVDAGQRYTDPRCEPFAQTTPVMLCKTANDALIKIRVDMLSDRPHAMHNHVLQGTDGSYESGRGGPVDQPKLWLRSLSDEPRWFDLNELLANDDFVGKHLPEAWRNPPAEALKAGHGGGDYFEVLDFMNAVTGAAPCPIGIHEAMDMTLPGLISQQSVLEGGRWINVPDSRKWVSGAPQPQLHMISPERRLGQAPALPPLPDGYILRQYTDADADQYLALMHKAGFTDWPRERLEGLKHSLLPDSFFVVEHRPSKTVVATALATHSPTELHPFGAQLGWVAGDPEHKGRKLGMIVSAAATARMLQAGYRRVYLQTDDFRLPAIKVYLDLGYEPLLYCEGMTERWQDVEAALAKPR